SASEGTPVGICQPSGKGKFNSKSYGTVLTSFCSAIRIVRCNMMIVNRVICLAQPNERGHAAGLPVPSIGKEFLSLV
ncbi:MAG: hypothetical protein RLZZ192_499, partial [Pseudomonadota bacterium]